MCARIVIIDRCTIFMLKFMFLRYEIIRFNEAEV